jgi:hypothetical protein
VSCLQEAVKLWCLCKLPYNEDRPMLSCDYCQDWFHYDCVGLRPPSDDEDDEEVAPPDFKCPACCLKVRTRPPSGLQSPFYGISLGCALWSAFTQD